jgi:hypothetical protein
MPPPASAWQDASGAIGRNSTGAANGWLHEGFVVAFAGSPFLV